MNRAGVACAQLAAGGGYWGLRGSYVWPTMVRGCQGCGRVTQVKMRAGDWWILRYAIRGRQRSDTPACRDGQVTVPEAESGGVAKARTGRAGRSGCDRPWLRRRRLLHAVTF